MATRTHGARSGDRSVCCTHNVQQFARGAVLMGTKVHKTNGASSTAATLRPLADRVVARPLEREAMTKSGIMLPDTAKEKPMRGTVVATGEGRRNEKGARVPLDVHV